MSLRDEIIRKLKKDEQHRDAIPSGENAENEADGATGTENAPVIVNMK